MGDEILNVLYEQIKEEKSKLLTDKRIAAYKFLDSAYFYVDCRDCVSDDFDEWEQRILFALNYLCGLSRKSSRDDIKKQLAELRYIMGCRLGSNPGVTEAEERLFEIVESFKKVEA